MAFKGAGKAGGTGGKFDQEDRSRDWYCPKCNERNFMRRPECFKCKGPKPPDSEGKPPPGIPQTGETLNGMVKSYNRKGFGFIMALNGSPACQDIYYSRENLHPLLQTRDIPGEHVTFEIQRFPDGKLVAKNVRPHGESESQLRAALDKHPPHPPPSKSKGNSKGGRGGNDEEDRSRDWNCERCGERNFVKRFECFKCKEPRKVADDEGFAPAPGPRRTFSPHAGARAIREALAGRARKSRSRSARRRSGSSDSSSSSSHKKKKNKKGKKKKKRSSSSSRSSSKSSKSSKANPEGEEVDSAGAQEPAAAKNPEVEKAKADSLEKLLKLKSVEPPQQRMKEYRELLRQWHPDKNPDKVEVATAVFQFLQKAKPMLEAK